MLFEWDENKRCANIRKHGIDFIRAQEAFDGRPVYEYSSSFAAETRIVTVAQLESRIVAIVWVWRQENTVRIISARSARDGEKRKYRELYG